MSDRPTFPSLPINLLSVAFVITILIPLFTFTSAWGINYAGYYPWATRILVLIVSVGAAVAVMTVGQSKKLPAKLLNPLIYVVVPLFLLAMFYFLRVSTHYLGDGILRIREVELGVWWLPTEPLGQAINYAVFKITSSLFDLTPTQAVELVSYIGGILYYFALIGFVRTVFSERSMQLLMFVVLYFSGTTLLFCGYAETYMLMPAFIAWFFTAGIKSVRDRTSPILVSLLFLFLVLFHFKTLIFLPCLLLLAYYEWQNQNKTHAIITIAAIVISLAMVIILPTLSNLPSLSLTQLMLPFAGPDAEYKFLSGQHILDIVNEIFLTAAAALILLIASFTVKAKSRARQNRSLLFVAAALPGAIGMLVVLRSALGYGVDWDLFSSATLIFSFFVAMLFAGYKELKTCKIAPIALATVAFLSFFSFAAVNTNADMAIQRQLDILDLYGKEGAIGLETVANHLNAIGRTDMAEQIWKRSLRLRPHVRIYANLAQLSLNQGRITDAKYYSEKGIELDPSRAMLWNRLAIVYSQYKDFQAADSCFRMATKLEPNDASYHHNYALMLLQSGRFAEAETEVIRGLQIVPNDPTMTTALGLALMKQNKLAEARSNFERAITIAPNLADSYLNLAQTIAMQGDTLGAQTMLRDFLNSHPKAPLREPMQKLLDDLSR